MGGKLRVVGNSSKQGYRRGRGPLFDFGKISCESTSSAR